MAKLIVNHKVENFEKWKAVFDSMHGLRKQMGCTGEDVYQGHSNSNEVAIITYWGNLDQARSYGQSSELKEGMKNAGVTSQPGIYFVD